MEMEQVVFNILSSDNLECKIMKPKRKNTHTQTNSATSPSQSYIYITSKTYDSSSQYLAPPFESSPKLSSERNNPNFFSS